MSVTASDWADALAALEHDVAAAELVLQDLTSTTPADDGDAPVTSPWQPPAELGPLPDALAERARDLVARQRRVAVELAAATALVRRQVRYADRVVDLTGQPQPRPAYLDVQA